MELLVIGALALIVFGPNRLPQIARSVGKAVNEFRRQAADLKSEFDLSLDEEDEAPAHVDPQPKPSQDPDPAPGGEPGPATGDPDPTSDPGTTTPDKN